MKRSKFKEPFCGFPDGFHEFDSLPEMPEDDCCIHCGRPRREIESSQQANAADKIQLGEILECPSCHATGPAEVFRR